MSNRNELSEKWIKASIIGTIWAASEIVLGSFLHNLRIPFSSNVLTAIGIVILISASYKWTEKGLFWRAGLICALMKTMSPSAIIIGPMVAIFSQSLLLELFTRVFGRNVIGFIIGAMFAMTWNLFHKIMNFIIYYGFNIVNVYSNLLKYAQKQLNISIDLVWSPILVIAVIYCMLGLISAIIGMKVGIKLKQQASENRPVETKPHLPVLNKGKQDFNYSVVWLLIDIGFIIAAFTLLNLTRWPVWSSSILVIVLIWIFRYKRALRQLSRPRFWVYFVLITLGTSFAISKIQSQDLLVGLEIGIQMNFRAAIVILGFSVLGTELYNPKVRAYFAKTAFRQLPLALELAFESLPMMIASVPEFRVIVKNPVSVIYQVLSQMEQRLDEVKLKLAKRVMIITGAIGQGKTTQSFRLVEMLKSKNIPVSGICCPRIMEGKDTVGYDIVDVAGIGSRIPFLRVDNNPDLERIGKYGIYPGALRVGNDVLRKALDDDAGVIVVDEVGKMELEGHGWAQNIDKLVGSSAILVLAVRNTFVDDVVKKWALKNFTVFEVAENVYMEVSAMVEKQLNQRNTLS